MKGGKRQGAGRPKQWNDKLYPLQKTMLPKILTNALLEARANKVPISKLISAIKQTA